MISEAQKKWLISEYIRTPRGRRRLAQALLEASARQTRTCSAGVNWRWLGREHLLVARALEIDHERVAVTYDPRVVVSVQGMTRDEFSRWAPRLHRRFGFSLRGSE